jgi:signal transduction histidine kinase
MKRSLKIHIFIHVLILTSLIVFANRTIAQWLLLDQMKSLLRNGLVTAFVSCEDDIDHADQFFMCHRKISPGNILNSFADFYVLCPALSSTNSATRPPECKLGLNQSSIWNKAQKIPNQNLEFGSLDVKDDVWLGVRRTDANGDAGAVLMVNQGQALNMLNQMWSYRDRNLVFALPIIVLMLMILAIYLAYVLTRAIASLEQALTSLNVNNLDEAKRLNSPYREFESLVSVFEDLRRRLLESFARTRRFAADASHELRTPLTILRGNSELMINELPAGTKTYDQVRKIHEEAERLIEITEKLLMLSRADANSIKLSATDMDLSEFLEEIVEYGIEAFPHIKNTSDIQAGVIWHCDASLIGQLIHNLYANAVKYNIKDGWIHIQLQQKDSHIRIVIANSTDVIPDELNARAFERFYRGNFSHSRQADGQGLGLSIALEIAKAHEAKLSIHAEDQKVVLTLDVST